MKQIRPTQWNFWGNTVNKIPFVCIFSIFSASLLAYFVDATQIEQVQAAENSDIKFGNLSALEVRTGWLSLFDGASSFGWRKASDANWNFNDQLISVSKGEKGLLRTTTQFDDFELKVQFKISASTNSGIFIRTSPNPKDPAIDCIEVNLAGPSVSPFSTGNLVARKKGADVSAAKDDWFEKWHEAHIVADGPNITVSIDNEEVCRYVDPKAARGIGRGYIGLQFNSGKAKFKSVRLRPINTTSLFNGFDLAGWNTDQKLKSEFKVNDSKELHILSGRGQIESEHQFGDFIFSMKCKTNAIGLNSGVFFRCIPGELMNGYESQIQNQFKDEDRSKPVDCGTGGIFRRQQARLVNANDQEWFSKTIIATGPHIAVWVNGYQVTDWSDTRKPDPNPRRGMRLEKGTIIFQGHDPTTDILIKDINARELKPRNR